MTVISKEYAMALFMLAKEENEEDKYDEALKSVSELFHEYPEYLDILDSPDISRKEKTSMITEAFSEAYPENVVSFIRLLCDEKLIKTFEECVEEYEELLMISKNVIKADVASAVELTDDEKKRISEKLEKVCGTVVIPGFRVDSGLIGGIKITVDDKVWDGSLKNKLSEIKEVMNYEHKA